MTIDLTTSSPPPHGPHHDHPTTSGFTARVVGPVVLAGWILLSNLVLILALVTSDRRRKISFNLHAINLAICNLIMGGLVLPFLADFELKGPWAHSDNLCKTWLIADLLVATVSVLIVGMMVFDRFVLFSCSSIKHGGGRFIFSALVFLTPWALAGSFVVPVYLYGETGEGVDASSGVCYLKLDSTFSIGLVLGSYFAPGVAALGLLVAMTLSWFIRRASIRELSWSSEMDCNGWQVIVSWLVSLTVVGMLLPFCTLYLVLFLTDTEWPLEWLEPAMWVAYAHAGVTPLVWLVMPPILKSVTRLCCCCCCKNKEDRPPRRRQPVAEEHKHGDDAKVAMLDFRYKEKH